MNNGAAAVVAVPLAVMIPRVAIRVLGWWKVAIFQLLLRLLLLWLGGIGVGSFLNANGIGTCQRASAHDPWKAVIIISVIIIKTLSSHLPSHCQWSIGWM